MFLPHQSYHNVSVANNEFFSLGSTQFNMGTTASCLALFVYGANGSCSWNVADYGTVDLSPLQNVEIDILREEKQQYTLLYTPCSNGVYCDKYDNPNMMALQAQTGNLPDVVCTGGISEWDDGQTHPKHEKNENNEDVIIFEYPLLPPDNTGHDSCYSGRIGTFTFICDTNATSYQTVEFHQPAINEGLCECFATIRSIHACPSVSSNTNNDSLSLGSICLIAFVGCILMYCIGGYLINGYKRKEWKDFKTNLPQFSTFWVYLPVLVKTGCTVSKEYLWGAIGRNNYAAETEEELYDPENDNL